MMSRKTSIVLNVIAGILAALIFIGLGAYHLYHPKLITFGGNLIPYGEFAVGILIIVTMPIQIKRVHHKYDMDEMLEDYRQRKKPRP